MDKRDPGICSLELSNELHAFILYTKKRNRVFTILPHQASSESNILNQHAVRHPKAFRNPN
jgi:hypothetical protein